MRAADIMTARVDAVPEHAPLSEAVRLLAATARPALPVVDADGRLVGLIAAAQLLGRLQDLLDRLGGSGTPGGVDTAMTTADAMTTPVLAVSADTDVRDLATALDDAATSVLPVVRGFAPIGVVGRLELLRAVPRTAYGPVPRDLRETP